MASPVTCLLLCRDCGDPSRALPMTFTSPAERGRWAGQHTREVITTLDEIRERARDWLAVHAGDLARDIRLTWPDWFAPWVAGVGIKTAIDPAELLRGPLDLDELAARVRGIPLLAYVSFTIGEDVTVPLPEGAARREG